METVYFVISGGMIFSPKTKDTYNLTPWKTGITQPWITSFDTFQDACNFKHIIERKYHLKYLSIDSIQINCHPVPADESQYGMNI